MDILYSFRRCPYAMRARMAIAVSGIQVELREVVLRDKPQSLHDISAKATVPVLLTQEQVVIDESLDIMCWALQQSDPENWLDDIDQAFITNNDDSFKYWLDRYKYADRYPEQSEAFYRKKGEEFLLLLEQQLNKTAYLSGEKIGFTDIAIFPFIRQFASVNKDWFEHAPYPKLQAWLNQLIDSVLFQTTMIKYQPWKEGGRAIVFPNGV